MSISDSNISSLPGDSASSGPHPAEAPRDRNRTAATGVTVRMLRRLHFFAGIICAPLIMVAAITGFLYAFAPSVENMVHRDLIATEVGESRVPTGELVRTAQEEYPEFPVSGIRLDDSPEATVRVMFADPELNGTSRAVFMDPYTGQVLGDSTQYGSSNAFPLRQWLSEGHRMAWLGEPGRFYSEIAASWLGVLAVGGLVLWWNRQRGNRKEKSRSMFRIGQAKGRTRNMRWHGALGTVLALGMIFLSITGLTWSKVAGANIGDVRAAMSWGTPAVSMTLDDVPTATSDSHNHGDHSGHEGHAGHDTHVAGGEDDAAAIDVTTIDKVSATALSELRAPITLTPPPESGQAWTAGEDRTSYRYSNDSIAVDGNSGEITDRLAFSDWPFMAKMSAWLIQLHMGTLFGVANQLILAALAAGIIMMIVRGYLMWWQRRPRSRESSRLASPPARVGTTSPVTAGTLVLVGALVAWAVIAPAFGVTCLVFLLVSALWGLVQRRRSRNETTPNQDRALSSASG